ncbi:hypothetical protein BDQ17DRAFT_1415065 [Cyathus striatus]|nr:hypothetical protein BDQ17DRAFT_1415065 [Cyathus striatus]
MDDVPAEIWYHIASYLPEKMLHDLLAVNRPFFYVAMRIRYRVLKLSIGDKSMVEKVEKFKQYSLFNYVKMVKLTVRSRGDWKDPADGLRISRFTSMLDAIKQIYCLDELQVGAKVRGGDLVAPDETLLAFIRSLWETVAGSNLRSLHLISNASGWNLIPHEHNFPALRSFSLTLIGYGVPTYQSSSNLNKLNHFPVLDEFHFALEKEYTRGPDLESLPTFVLRQSSSLKSLTLIFPEESMDGLGTAHYLLTRCLSDNMAFLHLRKLDVRAGIFMYNLMEDLQLFQNLLSRCQNTLEELTLRDIVTMGRSADELSILKNMFHKLQRLTTSTIHSRLTKQLAELFKIGLVVETLQSLNIYWPSSLRPHFVDMERALEDQLKTHSYVHLKLQNIGLYFGGSPASLVTMQLLANAIPSIKSFWG